MVLTSEQRALALFTRFGFGPRPGDLAQVTDPRDALHAEIVKADSVLVGFDALTAAGLTGTSTNTALTFQARDARRAARVASENATAALADPAGRSENVEAAVAARVDALKGASTLDGRIFRNEVMLRLQKARTAPIGFLERLVAFWSNHFCVSAARGELARATAGSFEREAIRPHVLGRFADMLVAVERHPAMLAYLDNVESVGPEARGNRKKKHGLNENLAREILELHTVGVGGGYAQTDVTAFARVLTGWTVAGRDGRRGEPGSFAFDANLHEPGAQALLGRTYPAGNFGQGEAVLADLAVHPATARHLATKLVRHFIADEPPPAAVDRIAGVFAGSEGDLRAVSLALLDLPESWSLPATKLRTPFELLVATDRLLERPLTEPWTTLGALKQLGMSLWEPAGPNGFPDTVAAWASPEGMKLRLDFSAQAAHRYGGSATPVAILDDAFGAAASAETRAIVGQAESREQAIALILMAPEFQRR